VAVVLEQTGSCYRLEKISYLTNLLPGVFRKIGVRAKNYSIIRFHFCEIIEITVSILNSIWDWQAIIKNTFGQVELENFSGLTVFYFTVAKKLGVSRHT